MSSKISLGLVDDHQIVIDGLLSLLKDEPQFEFAFATTCPKDVLQNLKTKPVDVLLTDVMMPELPGNVLAKEVKKEFPQTKILALSMNGEGSLVNEMINDADISGYILKNVGKRYDPRSFVEFINTGRRMMPAFKHLSQQDKDAIASFILQQQDVQAKRYEKKMTAIDTFRMLPYYISGYNKFLSKSNLPAIAPPWGVLNAIDLNTGEYVWKTVLGEDSVFKAKGVKETGTENYGGPIITKGGLLFIAATKDRKFRAFNKKTGKLLWETELPAAGFATPATYEVNGRQYIVIACGGGKLGARSGDSYVAFALPGR